MVIYLKIFQEGCKEKTFEDEIELVWEKGGSGLNFYTDAQFWKEREGDFDEKTSDDWDVDMNVYYEKNTTHDRGQFCSKIFLIP